MSTRKVHNLKFENERLDRELGEALIRNATLESKNLELEKELAEARATISSLSQECDRHSDRMKRARAAAQEAAYLLEEEPGL